MFVRQRHIDYMKEIMEDTYKKDTSVDQKLLLMKRKFGEDIPLSRSTIWNVHCLLYLTYCVDPKKGPELFIQKDFNLYPKG